MLVLRCTVLIFVVYTVQCSPFLSDITGASKDLSQKVESRVDKTVPANDGKGDGVDDKAIQVAAMDVVKLGPDGSSITRNVLDKIKSGKGKKAKKSKKEPESDDEDDGPKKDDD